MYSAIGWLKLIEGTLSSLILEAKIVDITIPGDARVKDKELEDTEKSDQPLREEIRKLLKLKKVLYCQL